MAHKKNLLISSKTSWYLLGVKSIIAARIKYWSGAYRGLEHKQGLAEETICHYPSSCRLVWKDADNMVSWLLTTSTHLLALPRRR